MALEDGAFGEDEDPLGGEGGVCVERDTDVASGARHSRDADEVRRDECREGCCGELDIESNARRVPFLSIQSLEYSLRRSRPETLDTTAAGVKGKCETA